MAALRPTTHAMATASSTPPVSSARAAETPSSATGRLLNCSVRISSPDRPATPGRRLGPKRSSLSAATDWRRPVAAELSSRLVALATATTAPAAHAREGFLDPAPHPFQVEIGIEQHEDLAGQRVRRCGGDTRPPPEPRLQPPRERVVVVEAGYFETGPPGNGCVN